MSLWRTLREWTYSSALQIWTIQWKISCSENVSFFCYFRLMWYARSPTSQCSMIIVRWSWDRKLSLYSTMFGWTRFFSSPASIMHPLYSLSPIPLRIIFFATYLTFSVLWRTSHAEPIELIVRVLIEISLTYQNCPFQCTEAPRTLCRKLLPF